MGISLIQAYDHREAGAVMHSHSANALMATLLNPTASEFQCTHLEMMKGICGHGFYDTLTVPIIENTARECELTDRMRDAMVKYPRSNAVLVRRHGVYVWGKTWIEAKTQAECYDYLFQAAAQMLQHGLDPARPPPALPVNGKSSNDVITNQDSNTGGTFAIAFPEVRMFGRVVTASDVNPSQRCIMAC